MLNLPVTNLHEHNTYHKPEWVTIGDNVIATENAREFDLTPNKTYKVNGIGKGLIVVHNDINENKAYSVKYFSQKTGKVE